VLLRDGIVRLLGSAGFDVAAACPDAESFLVAVDEHEPDLVVVDVRMPPTFTSEGIVAALRVRESHPETAVMVLSQYVEEQYATELVASRSKGVGYLLKDRVADTSDFIAALHDVAGGGTVLDPEVVTQLLTRARHADPLAALTPRERDVLDLMAQGRTNSAIGKALYISDGAVEKHVTSIFTKLDLPPADGDHRRVLAVLRWLDQED
jgi:DNA-binding NarL/FixJ family response regulator